MRIAVTGTPGVGKSTLVAEGERRGYRIVDVKAWAKKEGCVVDFDEDDDADVIDVVELAHLVPDDDGSKVLYDGHLSHLLDLDVVWVLRCDPRVLRERLEARGYKAAKVDENTEAEALDLILQEALDGGKNVVQRDATHRSPEALFDAFVAATRPMMTEPDLEAVDWSDQLGLGTGTADGAAAADLASTALDDVDGDVDD